MPFQIPSWISSSYPAYKDLDGKSPNLLLPWRSGLNPRDQQTIIKHLLKYVESGGKVFVEYTKGARKGTIAQLELKPEDLTDELYREVKTGLGEFSQINKREWRLIFENDDRVIKVHLEGYGGKNWPGVLRFDLPGTIWSYVAKERPKLPPAVLHDHFGVQLEEGQLVLYPEGRKGDVHTRFGHITGITAAGTIKVRSLKTQANHTAGEANVSPTIYASDLVVLEGDRSIKDKVLLARLAS